MLVELLPYAILLVVLALFVVLIRHVATHRRRLAERNLELTAAAAGRGYRPAAEDEQRVLAGMRSSPRFRNDTITPHVVLAKRAGGATRYMVSYTAAGRGGDSSTDRGTLFASQLDSDRLPRFVLHHSPVRLPRLVVAGIMKLAQLRYPGFEQVPLEAASPELAASLMLAESRDAGVQALDGGVIAVLSRCPGWQLESTGSWLLADTHGAGERALPDVETTLARLAEFDEIAAAFEA